MANENKPFGLKPIHDPGSNFRRTPYLIQSNDGKEYYINQPVSFVYYDAAHVFGSSVPGTYLDNTIAIYLVGSIIELFDPFGVPKQYHPPDTEDQGEWTAIVADHPKQRFLMQEGYSAAGPITESRHYVGANCDWSLLDRGNKKTGISKDVIYPVTAVATGLGTQNFTLIEPARVINNNWGEDYCDWVCEIQNHLLNI